MSDIIAFYYRLIADKDKVYVRHFHFIDRSMSAIIILSYVLYQYIFGCLGSLG